MTQVWGWIEGEKGLLSACEKPLSQLASQLGIRPLLSPLLLGHLIFHQAFYSSGFWYSLPRVS